jgi:hypothetical protein
MAVDMAAMNDLIAVRLFMVKKRNRRVNPLGVPRDGRPAAAGVQCSVGEEGGRRLQLSVFLSSLLFSSLVTNL